MSLQLISNNAYRLLAVAATASKKDIERNKSKFNAFLRVNRPVPSQPLDFPKLLGEVSRNLETIGKAESEISIPAGQLTHGMFWFVSMGPVDEECFGLLADGNVDGAISRWKADGAVSSLQNMMVCLLMKRSYREALVLAQNIFSVHFDEWKKMYALLSDTSAAEVGRLLLDSIYAEAPQEIVRMDFSAISADWQAYIRKKTVTPIADKIVALVDECKKKNANNPAQRFQDASDLLEKASPLLRELESLLKKDDITLLSVEDKVYSEVLNCSIASYNAVYDALTSEGGDDQFRQIAPQCNELAKKLRTDFVSPTVAKRIADNKKVIGEACSNIEKTIEEHIALNDQICWFCGKKGPTQIHEHSMSRSESNGTTRTTYTKTIKINCCRDCKREFAEREEWKLGTGIVVFIIAVAFILIFCDFWTDLGFFGWVGTAWIVGGLSLGLGQLIGKPLRDVILGDNVRKFKREVDDHPLVKIVRKEGYT